jgi:hypothetical protein
MIDDDCETDDETCKYYVDKCIGDFYTALHM